MKITWWKRYSGSGGGVYLEDDVGLNAVNIVSSKTGDRTALQREAARRLRGLAEQLERDAGGMGP